MSLNRLLRRFDGDEPTSPRTELLAGLTTFLTMAYILFVQPAVLSTDFAGRPTGLDPGAVLLATALAAALATALMGLWARYPIALAPGMGENFFFVTTVMALGAAGVGEAWRVALGIVFLAGLAFLLLSVFRLREAVVDAVSPSLAAGISAGIGLLIAFIGLKNAGLIVAAPGTLLALDPRVAPSALAVFGTGLAVSAALQARGRAAATLAGILAAAAVALALGRTEWSGLFGLPRIEQAAAFRLDLAGALSWTALPYLVAFLFMDLFDTVGTLVGVSAAAGWKGEGGLPRASRALLADAVGTMAGAAGCFLLAPLASPLVAMVAGDPAITAAALVLVGAAMLRGAARVAWDDFSEALPAFLVIAGIPLSFSIADGLALGFLSWPALKLLAGRSREVRWPMALAALAMAAYFVLVRARL